jgi:hypothetical protein
MRNIFIIFLFLFISSQAHTETLPEILVVQEEQNIKLNQGINQIFLNREAFSLVFIMPFYSRSESHLSKWFTAAFAEDLPPGFPKINVDKVESGSFFSAIAAAVPTGEAYTILVLNDNEGLKATFYESYGEVNYTFFTCHELCYSEEDPYSQSLNKLKSDGNTVTASWPIETVFLTSDKSSIPLSETDFSKINFVFHMDINDNSIVEENELIFLEIVF